MFPFELLNNPPKPVYPEYPAVVARARELEPWCVDPANLFPERPVAERRGDDWCTAVLGRPVDLTSRLTIHEQYLLIAADELGVDPALPDWIVEGRQRGEEHQRRREAAREAARQRARDGWAQALAAATLTAADLDVHFGSSPRAWVVDGYLGHVVPRVDVCSGTRKIRVHPAGRALCESPTRAKPLAISSSPAADGTPATCVRCLEWTKKVRHLPSKQFDELLASDADGRPVPEYDDDQGASDDG